MIGLRVGLEVGGQAISASPGAASSNGFVDAADPRFGSFSTTSTGEQNRAALQAALQYLYSTFGGGICYVPPGAYKLSRHPGTGLSQRMSIDFMGLHNIEIWASGAKFIASGNLNNGDFYFWQIRGCTNITIIGATFSITAADASNINEQTHHIQIGGSGNAGNGSNNTKILRCNFIEGAGGDGIRVLGDVNPDTHNTNIMIDSCRFVGCDRSGIGIQRGVNRIWVTNNHFEGTGDQDLDMESTSPGPLDNFFVCNNTFIRGTYTTLMSVTLTGEGTDLMQKSYFCNNTIIGGCISLYNNANCWVSGNYFDLDRSNVVDGDPVINCFRRIEDCWITDNFIRIGPLAAAAMPEVGWNPICIVHNAGKNPKNVVVRGNRIEQHSYGSAILMDGVDGFVVDGNSITYHNTTADLNATGFVGVQTRSISGFTSRGGRITNNRVTRGVLASDGVTVAARMLAGIQIGNGGTATMGAQVVSGNYIDGARFGVFCFSTLANCPDGPPVVTGNHFLPAGASTAMVGATGAPAIEAWCIGGNPGTNSPGQYAGTGAPGGVVAASPGSTYVRTTGELYLKTSGTDSSGWTQIT